MEAPATSNTRRRVIPHSDPQPIRYRLPDSSNGSDSPSASTRGTEQRPHQSSSDTSLEEDYAPLVLASSHAALALFVTQALSTLLIANHYSATITVRFYKGFAPYLAIAVPSNAGLVPIVTYSTVLSVAVVCLLALRSLIVHRNDPLTMKGWATGLGMAGSLLAFQYLRNWFNPPMVDLWVLAQAASGLVATTIVFVGCRPLPEQRKRGPVTGQTKEQEPRAPETVTSRTAARPKRRKITS